MNGEEVSSFFSFAVGEDEGTRAKALVAKRRERRNQNPPRRPRRVKEKLPPTASFWSSLRRVFLFFRRICYCCCCWCCCFWWWWCSFFVSPLVQKPFFSLVFFRGNNNIHKPRSPHYPLLCSNLFFQPCWHNSGGYNFLLFANNPSSPNNPQKKRKSERARRRV